MRDVRKIYSFESKGILLDLSQTGEPPVCFFNSAIKDHCPGLGKNKTKSCQRTGCQV